MDTTFDPTPILTGTASVTRPGQVIPLRENAKSMRDAAVAGLLGSTEVAIDAGRHRAALELAWKRQLNGWDEA